MQEKEEEEKTPTQPDQVLAREPNNELISDDNDDQPQQTHRHTRDLSEVIEGWEKLLRRANELEDDAITVLGLPPTEITSEGLDSRDTKLSSLQCEFSAQAECLLVAKLLNHHLMEESARRSLKFIQHTAMKLTGERLETGIFEVDEIAMSAVGVLQDMQKLPPAPTVPALGPLLDKNEYILEVDGKKKKMAREMSGRKFVKKKMRTLGHEKEKEEEVVEVQQPERVEEDYPGTQTSPVVFVASKPNSENGRPDDNPPIVGSWLLDDTPRMTLK